MAVQQVTSEGGKAKATGEPLAVHFPSQHANGNQPAQVVLQPFPIPWPGRATAKARPVVPDAVGIQPLLLKLPVERRREGQAAHRAQGTRMAALIKKLSGMFDGGIPQCWQPTECSQRSDSVLLLASASPARRRLLELAQIPHRVRVSGVDESSIENHDPALLVQQLALAKATAVSDGIDADISSVLGCDSLLLFEGEVFGKPQDAEEAAARWRRMAGGSGELLTGHALLVRSGENRLACISTRVHFAAITEEEIQAYVTTGEPLHCAGGFALEGRGASLIAGLEGCYSNVIGLSLPWLRSVLRDSKMDQSASG
jgi:septum formation protein